MAKSLFVAFFLWGTLGLFGAHHFYLRRDRHGLIHLVTLGGFVLGWFYDAFRMRHYVKWANFDGDFKEKYVEKMKSQNRPSRSLLENVAGTVLAHSLWTLVRSAIPTGYVPDYLNQYMMPLLMTLVLAYAVYFLGNIGESEGSYWSALKGALVSLLYYLYIPDATSIWCLMASEHTFGKKKKFRLKPEDRGSRLRRLASNAAFLGIISLLLLSYFYFNCTTKADEGEPEVRCIDSVRNFFSSSGWKNLSDTMVMLYNYVRYHGFGSLWKEIYKAFDTTGEENAAVLLGVSKTATEVEIKAVYKKLARQYHPDKVKDPEERLVAEQKFMEIAAAYELLSTTKMKRARTNKKPPKEHNVKSEL